MEAFPDSPGETPYYHFIDVDPGEFVIKDLSDVSYLWHYLCAVAEANPGFIPLFEVEDRSGK